MTTLKLGLKLTLIVSILAVLIANASGATYEISNKGQWEKLQKIIQPGDTILVKNVSVLNVSVSGSADKPIRIVGSSDGDISSKYSLMLKNASYIHIENFEVNSFDVGILLKNSSHITISDVRVTNSTYGIGMFDSDNVTLHDGEFYSNEIGFYCSSCKELTLESSNFIKNHKGVVLDNSYNLTVKGVNVSFNKESGIVANVKNMLIRETVVSNNNNGLSVNGTATIINSLFHSNFNGLILNGTFKLFNSDVVRNGDGYALLLSGNLTVDSCIFAFNSGKDPILVNGKLISRNSIYYDTFPIRFSDRTVDESDIDGTWETNMVVDPKFVDSKSDFHLTKDSPAVDSGSPLLNVDIEYKKRPWGEGYDIGCYELIYQIIKNVTVTEAYELIESGKVVIIDIRTPREFSSGHIENAINIDFYSPTFKQELNKLDKAKAYLIYCRTGHRTGIALGLMKELGFMEVYNMLGGITAWVKNGYPIVR